MPGEKLAGEKLARMMACARVPGAAQASSDLTLWAAGGALKPTESQAGVPTRVSLPQAWHHAAADALGGIMVALEARRQSGRGQQVVTSAQASATRTG